ncbi:MAG: ADP-ribosylglycohydrolase family protein [Lentisphaeria bacterium]|nr:ADP-ribosylglycohydrolase family protein [Lentisphaeria bacterium]
MTQQDERRTFQNNPRIRFNKLKGMFWGLVVGDCLGSPIQFTGKDNHPYITEMVPCHFFGTPAGYWTDDSSTAFCVAESAVRLQRYDLKDIANNFVRWFVDGFLSSLPEAFDVGGATASAIRGIKNGLLKNGYEESQGNGSIMRFAPSYIINYGNDSNKILYEISDVTHDSQTIRDTVALMASICNEHLLGQRTSHKSSYNSREDVNNSGWAVSTLQAALWAFETTNTFEDGMIAAVNLGGDADSIGAVFGQIAGAYYGFEAIPERWLDKIKDREKVNALIEACVGLHFEDSAPKSYNPLYGALGGDFIGSIYEGHNIKTKTFELVSPRCHLTDDSILTLATADAILHKDDLYKNYYHAWGNKYPYAGYGGRFRAWLASPIEKAWSYGSWGNGSAMRISPIGFAFNTEAEVLEQAEKSANTTHSHPEGVKGAQAAALAVFWARTGRSKEEIQQGITERFGYDLSMPLDEIRPTYRFDVSCMGTLPVAIRAFLESTSYEDAIRNAISVGGDSDTIAAITGGIALAFYKEMPEQLIKAIESKLDDDMLSVCRDFAERFQ